MRYRIYGTVEPFRVARPEAVGLTLTNALQLKRACRASREELLHNALLTAFFRKSDVDVLLLSRSEDVYAVGATYEADAKTRNLAAHRSLYLSLLGDELAAGEARRTQMRIIIDDFGSDSAKQINL